MKSTIQLVPFGEYPHVSGAVQVIDRESVASMVETFAASRGVLVDVDHYSELGTAVADAVDSLGVELPTEAAGWVRSVRAGADGLYGDVDWTDMGEGAVTSKRYRFLSPVWRYSDLVQLGDGRVRPLKLAKVGITNMPNIKTGRAICNSEGESLVNADVFVEIVDENAPIDKEQNMTDELEMELRGKLAQAEAEVAQLKGVIANREIEDDLTAHSEIAQRF